MQQITQILPIATDAYPNPLQDLVRLVSVLVYAVVKVGAAHYKNGWHNKDYRLCIKA